MGTIKTNLLFCCSLFIIFMPFPSLASETVVLDYVPRCDYQVVHTIEFVETETLTTRSRRESAPEPTDEDFQAVLEKSLRTIQQKVEEHQADNALITSLQRDITTFTDRRSTRISIELSADLILNCTEDTSLPLTPAPYNRLGERQSGISSTISTGESITIDPERIRQQRAQRLAEDEASVDNDAWLALLEEQHHETDTQELASILRALNLQQGQAHDESTATRLAQYNGIRIEAESSLEYELVYDFWLKAVYRGNQLQELILKPLHPESDRERLQLYLDALGIPDSADGIDMQFFNPNWAVGKVTIYDDHFTIEASFDENDAAERVTGIVIRFHPMR